MMHEMKKAMYPFPVEKKNRTPEPTGGEKKRKRVSPLRSSKGGMIFFYRGW